MLRSRRFIAIIVFLVTVGCTPKPPAERDQAANKAPAETLKHTSVASAAPQAEPDEGDAGDPRTEAEMLSQFDALVVPPPVGPNGESRVYRSDSTTANAVTGDVTISTSKAHQDPATETQTMFVRTSTGLVYELHNIPAGGVDAYGALDWTKIMDTPVGMANFLKNGGDLPETLVFVYRVIGETVPSSAPNGGFCGPRKTGYLAFTVHSSGSTADYPVAIAAFGEGSWPPKNSSSLCGTYQYTPISNP